MRDTTLRRLFAAGAMSAVLAGCSSSGSSPVEPGSTAPGGGTTSTVSVPPTQRYLDSVNALCDALLPKIIKVTHGGSIDVPTREYLATWPAHQRLLNGFDAHLASVPVPAPAKGEAIVLTAYVHFADRLDAARLAAAHEGQAAFAKEVKSESGVENDPAINALATAGFNDSCTAR